MVGDRYDAFRVQNASGEARLDREWEDQPFRQNGGVAIHPVMERPPYAVANQQRTGQDGGDERRTRRQRQERFAVVNAIATEKPEEGHGAVKGIRVGK